MAKLSDLVLRLYMQCLHVCCFTSLAKPIYTSLLEFKTSLRLTVFNSVTCPDAWAFLYRLCGRESTSKTKTSQEITDRWASGLFGIAVHNKPSNRCIHNNEPLAGGATRNKLLKEFVQKVYQPAASYDDNKVACHMLLVCACVCIATYMLPSCCCDCRSSCCYDCPYSFATIAINSHNSIKTIF